MCALVECCYSVHDVYGCHQLHSEGARLFVRREVVNACCPLFGAGIVFIFVCFLCLLIICFFICLF